MPKKHLSDCRTGSDFIQYAAKQGADVHAGGKHIKISTSKGTTVCGCHGSKELPTGTRHALVKQLMLIGISLVSVGLILIAILIQNYR